MRYILLKNLIMVLGFCKKKLMGKTKSLNPIFSYQLLSTYIMHFPQTPGPYICGPKSSGMDPQVFQFSVLLMFSMHPAFSCWWAWVYQLLFAFETPQKKTKRKPFWQNATNQKIHCKRSNLGVNTLVSRKISFVEITRWKLTSLFWRVPPSNFDLI